MGSTSRLSQQVTVPDDLAPLMTGIAIEARDFNWSNGKIRSEVSRLLDRWQTLTDPVLNADFFRPGDLAVGNVTMGLLPITVMGTWDGLESNHRATLVDSGGTRMSVVFVSCRHARLHGDDRYETFGSVPSLERQQQADRDAAGTGQQLDAATLIADHLQGIADQYPAEVFTDREIARCVEAGIVTDGIAGTAIRERLQAEIKSLQGDAS